MLNKETRDLIIEGEFNGDFYISMLNAQFGYNDYKIDPMIIRCVEYQINNDGRIVIHSDGEIKIHMSLSALKKDIWVESTEEINPKIMAIYCHNNILEAEESLEKMEKMVLEKYNIYRLSQLN